MSKAPVYEKQNVEDILALTPMQEGMLFHYLKEPDSVQYHEQLSWRLSGPFEPEKIRAAWTAVAETNEMLRTVFRWDLEKPVQIVLKHFEIPIHQFDVTTAAEPERELAAIKEKDYAEKIDIRTHPLRITVCKLEMNLFEIIISNHHIIYDGWSNGLLVKEFLETYAGLSSGQKPFKPLKTKYKEFVKRSQRQNSEKQRAFWKDYLQGFDSKTPLPTNVRKGNPEHVCGKYEFLSETDLQYRLNDFAKKAEITLAAVIYNAWGLLLQKYSNRSEAVFGITVSGRTSEISGIENMIGLFINTIPLRITTQPEETVSGWLNQTAQSLRELEEFAATPLTLIKSETAILNREDLFDSIVVIENYPLELAFSNFNGAIQVKGFEIREMTNFPLTLTIALNPGLKIGWNYFQDYFTEAEIEQLNSHFIQLIGEIISREEAPLRTLEMLSAAEKRQLVIDFNQSAHSYPKEKSLTDLFEEQVERTPERIALVYQESALTFAELNSQANQLGWALRQKGIGAGSIVGVLVERSLEMIIAILGIIKAGAAYLPIDPDYPGERINYLVSHSQTPLLLTRNKMSVAPSEAQTEVAAIGELLGDASLPVTNLKLPYDPERLFYVLYTSGSTGVPKGVMVKAHAFVNLLLWFTADFSIADSDRVLLIAPVSFDLAQKNLYCSLITGGRLYLFPPGIYDYQAMSETIARESITIINCTPSAFYPLVDYNTTTGFQRLQSIKWVFLGGEPINLVKLWPWLESNVCGAEIVNTYGPTECTDIAASYRLPHREVTPAFNAPIGKPVFNTQIYILDPFQNLLPVGVAGELYIGGAGLAAGYYRNPELTAERFIRNPLMHNVECIMHNEEQQKTMPYGTSETNDFNYELCIMNSEFDSTLMYKTGDLARWLPDGNIEYLGRTDHQVKVRGFRIELGEIERNLLTHPAVQETVVIDREDPNHHKYLCAYVVMDPQVGESELRDHLGRFLPEYMIPAFFISLDKLPLTPNKKIDRKALPEPTGRIHTGSEYVPPETEIEIQIARICQKIFQTEQVGLNDNFFEIGGNSILLIQLHAQLEKLVPGKFTITDLFSYPTIAKLTKLIEPQPERHDLGPDLESQSPEVTPQEIAIIGIGLKLPLADTLDDFWSNLQSGQDCIRDIPEARRQDVELYLSAFGLAPQETKFVQAAYLERIDQFDYQYFKLSPREAALMDPNQRLFLETAWTSMEDAGYGGKKLVGSRTGVYLGYGSDSDYKRIIAACDREALSFSVPGNTRPIIASRLSYLMDFRGPNLIVDTTCSSSLVAVHLACQGLQNRECDLAIAGGIQIHLLPFRQVQIGIEASDGRAKTFDDNSDGTGTGEGVIAILLKPLHRAERDGDHIYAVIKGSAVNHDGASVGITAPNAMAQADVIERAWRNAGVDPETITYIEAHGTGTKLGDPIEIEGIQKAFRKYTKRKQFCAIGAVKTNLGHLDNTAGLAGLVKSVLALYHREILPSLHFRKPNRRIDFPESPVYLNDRLRFWENDEPARRCGVSAFGLSGTNCHVVLEEYWKETEGGSGLETIPKTVGKYVLPLSAQHQAGIRELIQKYYQWSIQTPAGNIADLCYTAATGRGHYNCRLALILKDWSDFQVKIRQISGSESLEFSGPDLFYGEYKIVPESQTHRGQNEITEQDIKERTKKADTELRRRTSAGDRETGILEAVCHWYIQGANPEWELLYQGENRQSLRLPTYPFNRQRCWLDTRKLLTKNPYSAAAPHPLFRGQALQAMDTAIFATEFDSQTDWVLNEHKINGACVMVGTTFLEMAAWVGRNYFPEGLRLENIQFLAPVIMGEKESRLAQLVLQSHEQHFQFYIATQGSPDSEKKESWTKHMEGIIRKATGQITAHFDINAFKEKHRHDILVPDLKRYNETTVFEFGPRWWNIREMYLGAGELLSYLETPADFRSELQDYVLYPSLLDNALTTIPLIQKLSGAHPGDAHPSDEAKIYLPFSYRGFRIHQPLPACFYSYVKLQGDFDPESEFISFDISLLQPSGEAFGEIEGYTLKKTAPSKLKTREKGELGQLFYEILWVPAPAPSNAPIPASGATCVFKDEKGLAEKLIERLRREGVTCIEVELGSEFQKVNDYQYRIRPIFEDYQRLFHQCQDMGISRILHLFSLRPLPGIVDSLGQLAEMKQRGVHSLFEMTKAVAELIHSPVAVFLITENANQVTGSEEILYPENAMLAGLGKVVEREYSNISCQLIDIDDASGMAESLGREFQIDPRSYQVAYRQGQRYVEEIHPLDLRRIAGQEIVYHETGVYVITGGCGGIGLEMAKYLGTKGKMNLALLSRTPLPPPAEWDEILNRNQPWRWVRAIRTIRELRQRGNQVNHYQADAADESQLGNVISRLREKYGRINGVIHCAGIAGDGFLIKKDLAKFEEVLAPKVQGTWLLDRLTRTDNPDFFILFSSNNTLMGVPGQGDYTTANAYLDAFAACRKMQTGGYTLGINWPAWKETGMAVDYHTNFDSIFYAIPTGMALEAYERILRHSLTRLSVGELNPRGRIHGLTIQDARTRLAPELEAKFGNLRESKSKDSAPKPPTGQRITLSGKDERQDYSEYERVIAGIWWEVLGFEELNIFDNFFEIGGDSIMITKVHSRLEKEFPGRVTVADLFTHTSIAKLAQFLSAPTVSKSPEPAPVKKDTADVKNEILELLNGLEQEDLTLDQVMNNYRKI